MAGNDNYSNDVLASTIDHWLANEAHDNIFTSNALLYKLKERKNYKVVTGGKKILEPIMYAENAGAGEHSGFGTLNTNRNDILTDAEFEMREYYAPILMSDREKAINQGKEKKLDIWEARTKNALETVKGRMNAHLYNSAVGGSNGLQLDGIGIIVDSAGVVGNIDPATNPWWASTEVAYTGDIVKDITTARLASSKGGTEKPDLGVCDEVVYQSLLEDADPTLYQTNTKLADVGFEAIKFRGMEVTYDEDCTAQTFYGLNTMYLFLRYYEGWDFVSSDKQRAHNQPVDGKFIFWKGNMTCGKRKAHFKVTGIV